MPGAANADSSPTLSAQISNMIVGVMSEYTGRGPTRARTYVADDLITTVLRETLTKAERILVINNEADTVRVSRSTYQRIMRSDLTSGVQSMSGRTVVASLADISIEPDIAVLNFVLEPIEG